jgi:hypothetical protein
MLKPGDLIFTGAYNDHIFHCVCRNRYQELMKFNLDINLDGEIEDFGITPREVAVMRKTGTIELPPAFIHGVRPANLHKQVLICDRFLVTNTYPNNIVLLTGNRVMYCISFAEEKFAGDEHARRYYLTGFVFSRLIPAWVDPCLSSRIGLNLASLLDVTTCVTVTGMELVSKCFSFCRGETTTFEPLIDPCPPSVLQILRHWQRARTFEARQILAKGMKAAGNRFRALEVSYSLDYWWVWSLIVPGRYTNHFQ